MERFQELLQKIAGDGLKGKKLELLELLGIIINHELHELNEPLARRSQLQFLILSNFSNFKNASIFVREI